MFEATKSAKIHKPALPETRTKDTSKPCRPMPAQRKPREAELLPELIHCRSANSKHRRCDICVESSIQTISSLGGFDSG